MPAKTTPKQRALVIGLILVGIVFTAFFGMRVFHDFKRFNGHRPPPPGKVETDVELIRDWMTVPFISRMYRAPEKNLFDAIGIPPFSNHDKSLKELNQEYYPNQAGYVLELVKMTIRAHQPPPTVPAAP